MIDLSKTPKTKIHFQIEFLRVRLLDINNRIKETKHEYEKSVAALEAELKATELHFKHANTLLSDKDLS